MTDTVTGGAAQTITLGEGRRIRTAAAYPDEAANVPGGERQRYFTAQQHAAWALRFRQIEPDEVAQMQASGAGFGVTIDPTASTEQRTTKDPRHGE